jgi:protein SCO1/2
MAKKNVFYLVFFLLLIVVFYGAIKLFVPGFFTQKFPPIGIVQPFAFKNQEGKTITEKDALGKVNVVNFFFTTCTSVCPRMNNNLKSVYEKFKNEPDFLMLSYTCDPSRDSVPVLKRYADSIAVNPFKWVFLTGDKDSLYAMARHSYMVDDPKTSAANLETDFLHTQFIALVNRRGEVLKIYDGIKPTEMNEMEIEIKKLLKN